MNVKAKAFVAAWIITVAVRLLMLDGGLDVDVVDFPIRLEPMPTDG